MSVDYQALLREQNIQVSMMTDRINQLNEINEKLKNALMFYAIEGNVFSSDPYCAVLEDSSFDKFDKQPVEIGTKARTVLNECLNLNK